MHSEQTTRKGPLLFPQAVWVTFETKERAISWEISMKFDASDVAKKNTLIINKHTGIDIYIKQNTFKINRALL